MKYNTNNHYSSKSNTITSLFIPPLILTIILTAVFAYSVYIRQPWFNKISTDNHQWLTGSSAIFAQNFFKEGLIKTKFALLENPPSVEFSSLEDRVIYASYPPGAILPIYLISKALNLAPSIKLVMTYNLLGHYLVTLLLSLTIYFFAYQRQFNLATSFIFSLIPIPIMLLMPGPLYYFQNVYFADQAILLPYALLILLEIIRSMVSNNKYRVILEVTEYIILFIGIFTDWLFIPVTCILFLNRILDYKSSAYYTQRSRISIVFYKIVVSFWLLPLIAISLIILQTAILRSYPLLINRFNCQSVIESCVYIPGSLSSEFWDHHMSKSYGSSAQWLIHSSLFFIFIFSIHLAYSKIRNKLVDFYSFKAFLIMSLIMLPNLIHTYILQHHAIIHDFSALKFALPLSTLPLALIPLTLLYQTKTNPQQKKDYFLFGLYILLLASVYSLQEHPRYPSLFPANSPEFEAIGTFIKQNTKYKHILYSPDIAIKTRPPQQLALSEKRVYHTNNYNEIAQWTKQITADYQIATLFLKKPTPDWIDRFNGTLIKHPTLDYYYFTINQDDWNKFTSN